MVNSEIVAIILAVGGLLPLLISIVQQPHWNARTRTVLSVIISGLAGLVAYVSQNGLEFSSASTAITVVVGIILTSVTSYQTIWKPSGVSRSIENTTSPHSSALEEIVPEDERIPDSW